MQATTNSTNLVGDPTKTGGLYLYINSFKTNRFGNAHSHPNDRFITVIDGAGWRGTGPVIDPANAKRMPKGSFSIDHANKLHWECPQLESFLCVDSEDLSAELEDDGGIMDAAVWEYVAQEAFDDISGGGWRDSYTGEWLGRDVMDGYG